MEGKAFQLEEHGQLRSMRPYLLHTLYRKNFEKHFVNSGYYTLIFRTY